MSTAQGMKRRREDPNTVLRPMSNSNESENERSQITGNNGLVNRTKRVRFQPPIVTTATLLARTQQRNMINLQTLRNALPRGIVNQFTNNRLQRAINTGEYQTMKNKIQAKIRQANQDETAIKVQLRQLPSGNFRSRLVSKINNVIGNTSKTGDMLRLINAEKRRINEVEKARAAAEKRQRNINKAARKQRIIKLLENIPSGNFKKNVNNEINTAIGNNTKTNALVQKIENEKKRINAAANKAAANKAVINKAIAEKRQRNINKAARKQRIIKLLENIPSGNFKKNVNNEINTAIGNNNKTNALVQKIENEKKRINAANRAAEIANLKQKIKNEKNRLNAANKAARKQRIIKLLENIPSGNFKKNVNNEINTAIGNNTKTNALIQKIENEKKRINAANKAAANKAEVNNRMSGRTSCPTSIGPLIENLNKYKNTATSPPPKILGTQNKILLEILALSRENAQKNAEGKEHRAYVLALLYDMFSVGLPKNFVQAKMKITRNTLITLAEHLMCVNTYSSSANNFKAQAFTLTDMQITEFLFLMWLDGWHDEYNETSFQSFLPTLAGNEGYFENRYITNSWNIMKSIVPENETININQNTLISKIINKVPVIREFIYDSTFTKKLQNAAKKKNPKTGKSKAPPTLKQRFETVLRDSIPELLGYELKDNRGNKNNISRPSINTNNKHMVLLDMENDQQRLSKTINNSPNLYPYLASASLIDPGRFKLGYYVLTDDITRIRTWIAEKNRNQKILNFNTRYHVGPTNMILKDKGGKTFLDVNLTVNLRGVAQNKLNKVNNNSFFSLKVNGKEVKIRTAKKNAKGAGVEFKMGKFMGDALQYMTVIVQNNTRERNRVFASGDGNACFMYMHLCKCIDQTPRIIIDNTQFTTYHGIE
jgi:hypothetical protein